MLKNWLLPILLLWISAALAQDNQSPYRSKKVAVTTAPIQLDSVSINKVFFKVLDAAGHPIDSTFYKVDFQKSILTFNQGFSSPDSLTVRFLKYPDYLTKKYSVYDDSRVVSNQAGQNLYAVTRDPLKKFVPFDGLNTSGSITRGITVGNNQNAVVNSNLDLQISGKLSEKVTLRASIQDSNIPLQEGGYSQKLDEFDQIFIELAGQRWAIRAGDLFLENRQSRFLNFNKKVQGISTTFNFGAEEKKTTVFASAALVRGQYAKSSFTGQEGNQGPYKLRGQNGELFVLVVSGSERVFVNGILLERGENNDYVIDYNAGEVTFTPTFPITSEMRINIEYQFSDRNYTRFVTYAGAMHEQKTWSLGGFVYSENDVKNQPLQQNLSEEQAQILVAAGDDQSLMTAPSAFEDSFSENKILYRKVTFNGVEIFEYSTDETLTLYNVKFTLVGNNLGNYILASTAAIGRIYQYVAPIDGVPQGNYEPITRLVPPEKLQIATVLGKFNPNEKTAVDFEAAVSNNDKNLFSNRDDGDNVGVATKANARQRLFTGSWKADAFVSHQFVQKDFRTIERLFTIEFDRDWNLTSPAGDQSLLVTGVNFEIAKPKDSVSAGYARYQFEKLDFTENFTGNRHVVDVSLKLKNWNIRELGSHLKSDSDDAKSEFTRNATLVKYNFKKNWIGGSFRFEDNRQKFKATGLLSPLSQKFSEYGAFIGRGDSTKVFAEIGYLHRVNDSLQNGILQRVNTSQSYYLKSRLIQTQTSDLSVFVNYRNLDYTDPAREDEPSLNSRILYNDKYFDQFLQVQAAYETASGTIAQQEFTYLEVDPGQGVYMWNDYNNDGTQQLEEFEVAPFPDQAIYVRVFLPNQVFVKTHQNKFSLSTTISPTQWQNKAGFRKFASLFYNQSAIIIDRKIMRDSDHFDLNPFGSSDRNVLGLSSNFRNSLFFNRGKQYHSVTYTFLLSQSRNLLSVGSQQADLRSHQVQYTHLYRKYWLFNLGNKFFESDVVSENFPEKNYEIEGYQLAPKISYLFSKNASWDIFYEYQVKDNTIGAFENLTQQRFGTSFTYASEKKLTTSGEFSLYQNKFTGNRQSPVAFQMLEGLQPGKNMTWRLLIQKNLTEFLDINVNYQGRKSETSQAIHTGNIQLRAFF